MLVPLLMIVLTVGALAACGDITAAPNENAQSLGNAANDSIHNAVTPTVAAKATATATKTPKPTATPAPRYTSNSCTTTADDTQARQYLLGLLNKHRADAGVAPLTLSPTISAVSQAHSCDMYRHGKLDHNGSDGSTPTQRIQSTGLAKHAWGENIGTASGFGLDGGIQRNDADMMAEPLECCNHHWNIVNANYKLVGIGIIYVNGQEWFTEDFAG